MGEAFSYEKIVTRHIGLTESALRRMMTKYHMARLKHQERHLNLGLGEFGGKLAVPSPYPRYRTSMPLSLVRLRDVLAPAQRRETDMNSFPDSPAYAEVRRMADTFYADFANDQIGRRFNSFEHRSRVLRQLTAKTYVLALA